MHVVDRDGLDGLIYEGGALRIGQVMAAPGRPRADSVSGLQALADLSRPDPPVDPTLASWTSLEPIAVMPSEAGDTSVDESADTSLFEGPLATAGGHAPTRVGRHARPTLEPPLGEASPRLRRPTARIVLSFAIGASALAAAVVLVILQSFGGVPGGASAPTSARAASVASVARVERAPVRAAPAAPAPVPAATIDRQVLHRRAPAPAGAVLPGGRLEWRLPARYSLGGEAPDVLDPESLAALAVALDRRCEPGTLVVVGHTCNVGPHLLNLVIGKRRALFARDLLVGSGVRAQGLRVASAAAVRPEASNATAAGRARNRRVTITCQPQRHAEARGEE